MKTTEYLAKAREITGLTNYKIAKNNGIDQTTISQYNKSKMTLTEKHAFLISEILKINPALVIADTKLEKAEQQKDLEKIKFWQKRREFVKTFF